MKLIALPAVWLVGIIAVIAAGFSPNGYLTYVRHIPPPHPYPTSTVFLIVLFMTIQVSLVFAILRPSSYRRSWGRAFFALVLSLGFLSYAMLATAMHAPPSNSAYFFWSLAFAGVMLGLLVWSSISALRSPTGT
jgi:hypothetical protein